MSYKIFIYSQNAVFSGRSFFSHAGQYRVVTALEGRVFKEVFKGIQRYSKVGKIFKFWAPGPPSH
jgi:hypothetical protein